MMVVVSLPGCRRLWRLPSACGGSWISLTAYLAEYPCRWRTIPFLHFFIPCSEIPAGFAIASRRRSGRWNKARRRPWEFRIGRKNGKDLEEGDGISIPVKASLRPTCGCPTISSEGVLPLLPSISEGVLAFSFLAFLRVSWHFLFFCGCPGISGIFLLIFSQVSARILEIQFCK